MANENIKNTAVTNPLDYELSTDDAIDELTRIVDEEYSCRDMEIFFFGKIINGDSWTGINSIDENKYYTKCPCCDELFKLKKKPQNGDVIDCPKCSFSGAAYDYRDKSVEVITYPPLYAYLEMFDNGYAIRFFECRLEYNNREFDNYETLFCHPDLNIRESAREYWCDGNISYYVNQNDYDDIPCFKLAESIDDDDYYLINYDNYFDPESSSTIYDIKYYAPYKSSTCIEAITRHIPCNAFRTLKKYGFKRLMNEMIYKPSYFCDSTKISELLKTDYNKIKAEFDAEEFSIEELEAIHTLERYNLEISRENADIAIKLNDRLQKIAKHDNLRKIFKYIRNQRHKAQSSTATDYADYITECEKLKYDLKSPSILYPTNLLNAHRRTSALIKIEDSELTNTAINELYENTHVAYEWSDGQYSVVMPKNADEIISEGAEQNHCVGGYCERVANGRCVILFIRRNTEIDIPFYTMEIRPDTKKLEIVQCRGYRNQDPSPEIRKEVEAFLVRYEKWFNMRKFNNDLGCMN